MNDVLSVGVIGAGGIARSHMKAISENENIRMVAVMDIDEERVAAAADEHRAKPYGDLDALLSDTEVEAIHVCTPHNQHADQTVAAAEAGKHVLVEKPMALTVEDCDRMIEACEAADRTLMVGQVIRHYPVSRKVKQLISDGAIGQVGHLLRRRLGNFNPSAEEGGIRHWYMDPEIGGNCVLYCFGPHEYDLLHWYMDSPVVQVYAQGNESTEHYRGQKDSYTAMMNHENGAVSVLSQSVVCHTGTNDQVIIGSEGSMTFTHRKLTLNGEEVPLDEPREGMRNQIHEFATCCLEGKTPDANGRSVRHTMAVIEAAKQSAERGAVVMVSEFDR